MTDGRKISLREERGFSLLEVLVAFAVTALFLGAMLPATIASLDRLALTKQRSAALSVARATLERHLAIAQFEEGSFEGTLNALKWRASVTRIRSGISAEPVALREVRVEVFADPTQSLITLAGYRMGQLK